MFTSAYNTMQTYVTYQKVIGDSSHAFMRQNNPDYYHVANHGHGNDAAISHSPQCDLPHRLDELVEVAAAVKGHVCPVCGVTVGGIVERVHFLGIRVFDELAVKNRPGSCY